MKRPFMSGRLSRPRCVCSLAVILAAIASLPAAARAVEPATAEVAYDPFIAPASDEAQRAIERFQVPEGMQVSVFAAEPLLANPVAFCIDERGRFYVAETFRHHAGVTDTRGHMYWVEDDLACRTVADRVAMYRKHLGEGVSTYNLEHDRVRRLVDRDGDGVADQSTVFADGFRNIPDGIGAGLLARANQVWYACIPDLWLLGDTNNDGRADERQSLHNGYGVHVGFLGHDLHGLTMGPDGLLYFSIGDRGLHLELGERTISVPDTGSVLRCRLDGSGLEIFATGLRNPQELAFDDFGNLFTGENNSDSGDKARFVHLVEGGDSGWRIGYQFITQPNLRGPWNSEKLWPPQHEGQPAYIIPPITNLGDGPSGIAYYPGIGFGERYEGHFFLCDFRGTAGLSGVRSFGLRPSGASFELIDEHQFIWSVLATDVDFGPDGALYISDWVEGWEKPNKGRIYRFVDSAADPAMCQEVARLLGRDLRRGTSTGSDAQLVELLSHRDRRVRLEAQFALAAKGTDAVPLLNEVAREDGHLLARVHAIWALGQIARDDPPAIVAVADWLTDPEAEIRAQSARVLGDARYVPACDGLIELLTDDQPRVRLCAALALAKLGQARAVAPLFQMLADNNDADPYLRHAGVMGLVGCADHDVLVAAVRHDSAAIRMGALLTMRRRADPAIEAFLADSDPRLVAEAARAINDVPIPDALPALAALLGRTGGDVMLTRRAINANLRIGGRAAAERLVRFATSSDADEVLRIEAIRALAGWPDPPDLDGVVGLWRPLAPRAGEEAQAALAPHVANLLTSAPAVGTATLEAAAALNLVQAADHASEVAVDADLPASVRLAALSVLDAVSDPRLEAAVLSAIEADEERLRAEGRRLLARLRPEKALPVLRKVLESGTVREQQSALLTLGEVPGAEADGLIAAWLSRLIVGEVPAELHLELLAAAEGRYATEVIQRLAAYRESFDPQDPLSGYRHALEGGDARAGRKIFLERAAVSCQRCHKIKGQGGEVGPDLSTIGKKKNREYLLASLIAPNRDIAEGFQTVVLVTDDGRSYAGIVKLETDEELTLITPDGVTLVLAQSEIDDRATGNSAMPDTLREQLNARDLRDLVEYLANLKY